jgi:hypothetical protein
MPAKLLVQMIALGNSIDVNRKRRHRCCSVEKKEMSMSKIAVELVGYFK